MLKYGFLVVYTLLGLGGLGLFALTDATGFFLPAFGYGSIVDTSSRQGYWYTYRQPPPSSSSGGSGYNGGRSPSSSGGYSGGGK